jgi:phosphomevalonate kinase
LQWVYKTQTPPNDPLFLIMLALGNQQFLLEQAPKNLNQLFDDQYERFIEIIERTLKESERAALISQRAAIAAAVSSLLKKTDWEQRSRLLGAIIPAAGILIAAIGVGVLLGMTVPLWLQGGYVANQTLTVAEVEDLRWLKSADGKLAKNLTRWNSGMLDNLNCLEDVERLNVTLEVQGKKAESGFCLLWVVPFQDRKFTSENKI